MRERCGFATACSIAGMPHALRSWTAATVTAATIAAASIVAPYIVGVTDPALVPPASLSAWEIHWPEHPEGDAPELWLHRRYLKGQASEYRAA
jgi:hypothetical protein